MVEEFRLESSQRCVEVAGALGGVRPWAETLARIDSGWQRLPTDWLKPFCSFPRTSTISLFQSKL